MNDAQPSHHNSGLYALLESPGVYDTVQWVLHRKSARRRYVSEHIQPFAGCRILDIGCGSGSILALLPDTVGQYVGFDMNPRYIEAARRRWGSRGEFRCRKVEAEALAEHDEFDVVLAHGILHHLVDDEARQLFEIAFKALKPGGRLVTHDNVYVPDQHWFARWLIGRDRGKAVRTQQGYEALALGQFQTVESAVWHDTLRVPYTTLIMRCMKTS